MLNPTVVYHPANWTTNWPQGKKPFISEDIAVAHGFERSEIVSSPFNGALADVVTEAPLLTEQEAEVIAENPGIIVEAVAPEAAIEFPAVTQAPVVVQAPASVTPSTAKKNSKKK